MKQLSFTALADFALIARLYQELRVEHPTTPALLVHAFLRDQDGLNFAEFVCAHTTGHDFPVPEEESDRCLCLNCGADGDA